MIAASLDSSEYTAIEDTMASLTAERDTPPASPPGSPSPLHISWDGNPWSLTGLCFLNMLLIIITLGIYWFWARTEYRRLMWQMVRVEHEPLEYSGTGTELLIGYLRLFAFVLLPLLAVVFGSQLALGPRHPLVAAGGFFLYFILLFLYFVGVFRAHRYILSRTRWRGIAFGLDKGAVGYGGASLWTSLLTGLTAGWLWPWRTVMLRRKLTSAMFFGSVPFKFLGSSGSLYLPFAFIWVSTALAFSAIFAIQFALLRLTQINPKPSASLILQSVPHTAVWLVLAAVPFAIIGLSWYEARKLNLFAHATKIGPLGSDLAATGGTVLWLTVSNWLIMGFSLGILRPVAQARRLRYLVTRLSFSGVANLDTVLRGQEQAGLQGAGLEAAFSIEIF